MDLPSGVADGESRQRLVNLVESMNAQDEWVAFLGAGLSTASGLPDWSDLLEDLLGRSVAGIAPENYPMQMQKALGTLGADQFWGQVRNLVCGDRTPSDGYRSIARLPFEAFVTTNLDCIFHEPHAFADPMIPAIICYPDALASRLSGRRLFHIHGNCGQLKGASDGAEPDVVLTEQQYFAAYSVASYLPTFLSVLFSELRILFVGASLAEPPILRAVNAARERMSSVQRTSGALPPQKVHYIFKGSRERNPESLGFHGMSIGVEPIYYLNESGTHESLIQILDWLTEVVGHSAATVRDSGGAP